MSDDSGQVLYCSFCGKSQHEVRKLIAGPSVFVCNECIDFPESWRQAGQVKRHAPQQSLL